MTYRPFFAACAVALCLAPVSVRADDLAGHPEGLHIHDAYARIQGGAGGSGAVFFMVHNNTETDDRLVAVVTNAAKRAELHSHAEAADGQMTMGKIEGGIPLAAGDVIELSRGGDHVMLLGMTRALKDGETFAMTLTFEAAGDVTIEVPVDNKRKPGDAGHDHDAMHHDGMNHDGMNHDAGASE